MLVSWNKFYSLIRVNCLSDYFLWYHVSVIRNVNVNHYADLIFEMFNRQAFKTVVNDSTIFKLELPNKNKT